MDLFKKTLTSGHFKGWYCRKDPNYFYNKNKQTGIKFDLFCSILILELPGMVYYFPIPQTPDQISYLMRFIDLNVN